MHCTCTLLTVVEDSFEFSFLMQLKKLSNCSWRDSSESSCDVSHGKNVILRLTLQWCIDESSNEKVKQETQLKKHKYLGRVHQVSKDLRRVGIRLGLLLAPRLNHLCGSDSTTEDVLHKQ